MNYIAAAFKYLGLVSLVALTWYNHKLKYVDKDGRTIEHKRTRSIVLRLGLVAGLVTLVASIVDDVYKAKTQYDLRQALIQITEGQTTIASGQSVGLAAIERERAIQEKVLLLASTNSGAGPTIASTLIQEKIDAVTQRKKEFEDISRGTFNLSNALDELTNKIELARLKTERDRLAEQVARPAKQAAEERKRRALEETMRKATNAMIERLSPRLEYTVKALQDILAERAQQTGTKLRSSRFDAGGLMVSGEHCEIDEGPSSLWVYDVSVLDFTPSSEKLKIKIICMSKNAQARDLRKKSKTEESGITDDHKYAITLNIDWYLNAGFDSVATELLISSKASDRTVILVDRQPLSKYHQTVDSALRSLVAAQTQQIATGN